MQLQEVQRLLVQELTRIRQSSPTTRTKKPLTEVRLLGKQAVLLPELPLEQHLVLLSLVLVQLSVL